MQLKQCCHQPPPEQAVATAANTDVEKAAVNSKSASASGAAKSCQDCFVIGSALLVAALVDSSKCLQLFAFLDLRNASIMAGDAPTSARSGATILHVGHGTFPATTPRLHAVLDTATFQPGFARVSKPVGYCGGQHLNIPIPKQQRLQEES